jgi:hypothetical protein
MSGTQQDLFSSNAIGHCLRCGVRCKRRPGNPEARLLKHTTSDGYCVNCAATEFLQGLAVVNDRSPKDKPFDPGCFRLPHVQAQFAVVLVAGNSDARPDEIDWLEIMANWDLPFPKPKRRGGKKG